MFPGADSTQLRAELAVMRIFRHLGVPADVFLQGDELARQGAACGIRAGDVPAAVDRLVKRGLLARRHEFPEQVACTVAGVNWFDEQPGWLEYHLLTPRVARARYARENGEVGIKGGRRRSGDLAVGR